MLEGGQPQEGEEAPGRVLLTEKCSYTSGPGADLAWRGPRIIHRLGGRAISFTFLFLIKAVRQRVR